MSVEAFHFCLFFVRLYGSLFVFSYLVKPASLFPFYFLISVPPLDGNANGPAFLFAEAQRPSSRLRLHEAQRSQGDLYARYASSKRRHQ